MGLTVNQWLAEFDPQMRSKTFNMILHNIKIKDLEKLEAVFAYLTQEGWFIPKWLQDLRDTIGTKLCA